MTLWHDTALPCLEIRFRTTEKGQERVERLIFEVPHLPHSYLHATRSHAFEQRPHTLERFDCSIDGHRLDDQNFSLRGLRVGILDQCDVLYIGGVFAYDDHPSYFFEEDYYFRENRPDAYRTHQTDYPCWPSDRAPFFDDRLRSCMISLEKLRERAGDSLRVCMGLLSQPGPDFFGVAGKPYFPDVVTNTPSRLVIP